MSNKIKMLSYDLVTERHFNEKQVPTMIRRGWTVCTTTKAVKPTKLKQENKTDGEN